MKISGISLITNVLDEKHLPVLSDWISFLNHPIQELVYIAGPSDNLKSRIDMFCRDRGIVSVCTDQVDPVVLTADETAFLRRQFKAACGRYAFVTRLDTFPFRTGEDDWLEKTIALMEQSGAVFFTGSTLPFRQDRPLEDPYMLTGRVSNSCLLIEPSTWLEVQSDPMARTEHYGRFSSEGIIEDYCERTGLRGLRRLNEPDWRVFHTQQWGPKAIEVRERFRAGQGISPFMQGYQDDLLYPWDKYFGWERPSRFKLLRIRLGRLRRQYQINLVDSDEI